MVWRGLGILAPVVVVVVFVISLTVCDFLVEKEGYFLSQNWHLPLILLVSGVINFFLGRHLNNKPPTPGKDPKTGQDILFVPLHTFYMLKIEYWGILLAISAIILFFVSSK